MFFCMFIAELVASVIVWTILQKLVDWIMSALTWIEYLRIMFCMIIPKTPINWIISKTHLIVNGGLTSIKRKITRRLKGQKPVLKSKRSFEITDPLILTITEPPMDWIFGYEYPLSPAGDGRLRLPRTTIVKLESVANEYRESMDCPSRVITQNEEPIIEEWQKKVESSKQIRQDLNIKLKRLIEKKNLSALLSNSLLPDENNVYSSAKISAMKNTINQLTEENCKLNSSLQLVTNKRAEEKDRYEKYLIEQDELGWELKTAVADCKDKQLEMIQNNVELKLLVQKVKEERTVFEENLKEKERTIEFYDEHLAPRILQLETENPSLKNTKSDATTKPQKQIEELIDEGLATLLEAIDRIEEDKGNTEATTDTGQDKTGNKIKNWFSKKRFSKAKPKPVFLSVMEITGSMMIDKAKSLKQVAKKMKAKGKELIKKAS